MKTYRRHFILLNMLLVGAVLLITLILAGVYIVRSEYANMKQTMQETLEPFSGVNGSFSFTPAQGEPKKDRKEEPERQDALPPEKKELPKNDVPEQTETLYGRCVTVFYENGTATIISGKSKTDTESLYAAADIAIGMEDTFGRLSEYDLFYLRTGNDENAKVCLYPAGYLRSSLLRTGIYLFAAFICTMLACYFISRYISKIAIRPVQQAMDREKQFVADVSHDLKTPLAVLQSCSHIILENPMQTVDEAKPWLERSDAAIQNMRSLIDDMLTLSAIDSAQPVLKRENVNLSSVVMKAVLQMDAMAYDRGITLSDDIQEGVSVNGDADALLRVATGLIENALKYEPQNGRITVALKEQGKKTVLTVQNFGACIAEEDLPHIFERFYRGDKARTAQQGHGLGLAIISRTVELMNGRIEAASARESGTVFTVTFG